MRLIMKKDRVVKMTSQKITTREIIRGNKMEIRTIVSIENQILNTKMIKIVILIQLEIT